MRLYLDRLGVKRKDRPESWRSGLKRRIKCWLERRLYGFDATETYSMDYTWHLWLYEHLKMFREYATEYIDMTEQRYEYNGEKYNQLEMIDMMLERLEYMLDPRSMYDDMDEEDAIYVGEIEKLGAISCYDMWW